MSYHIKSYHTIPYHTIPYHVTSITSHHITSHHISHHISYHISYHIRVHTHNMCIFMLQTVLLSQPQDSCWPRRLWRTANLPTAFWDDDGRFVTPPAEQNPAAKRGSSAGGNSLGATFGNIQSTSFFHCWVRRQGRKASETFWKYILPCFRATSKHVTSSKFEPSSLGMCMLFLKQHCASSDRHAGSEKHIFEVDSNHEPCMSWKENGNIEIRSTCIIVFCEPAPNSCCQLFFSTVWRRPPSLQQLNFLVWDYCSWRNAWRTGTKRNKVVT